MLGAQTGWLVLYENARRFGGLSMVLLQLKDNSSSYS